MKFGGPISRAGSSGSGVVCRSQGDWATSGFTPRVLSARCGNGVESCLVACNGWCGKETLVRTGKRPCSPSASLSPPHSSSCCTSACDATAAEVTGTEKTRASSSCAASQPVLSSGVAGWRSKKERTRALRNFPSSCVDGGKPAPEFTFCREILTFPVTSIYLCLLILFLTCNFNNWCDGEIKLAWVLTYPEFTQSSF